MLCSLSLRMSGVLLVACFSLFGFAERSYAAPPRVFKAGMTSADLQREFKAQLDEGFRLIDVSTCVVQREYKYAAIWEKRGTPEFRYESGYSAADLKAEYEKASKDGFRLTHLTSVDAAGELKHLAIWERTKGPEVLLRLALSRADFEAAHAEMSKSGHHLVRVCAAEKEGAIVFGGAWERGRSPKRELSLGLTTTAVPKTVASMKKKGFRAVQVCGYVAKKVERYALVWEKAEGPEQKVTVRLTDTGLEKVTARMTKAGFQAKQSCIYNVRELDRYAVVWEKIEKAK